MVSFVYHTRPDLPEDEALVDLAGETPLKSGTLGVAERRSGTQQDIAHTLAQNPQYGFINALSEGLRPDEKQLFIDTHVDARTGLLKRSGLNMYKRMLEDGRSVSIAFLDGDHFGALNDVCEKEFADRQISIMGEELGNMTELLREEGHEVFAVRWGGEEFVIFGEVEKNELEAALSQATEKIKTRIRQNISKDDLDEMASRIFLKKYASLPDGLERAKHEIGGITGGISRFQMPEYSEAKARNTVTYTDEILSSGKDVHGRGKMYVDQNTIVQATRAATDLHEDNALSPEQNAKFNELAKAFEEKINARFLEKTPQSAELFSRTASNSQSKKILDDYFKTPPFSLSGAEKASEQLDIAVGELRTAKIEIMRAQHDYGTYTGAATPKKLEECHESHPITGVIDISEFKSINDTIGHTHGDTYLMWCFNEVILDAAKACELNEEDIIIAQDRASFPFRIRSENPKILSQFAENLQRVYTIKLAQFTHQIAPTDPSFLDKIRSEWIRNDKSATMGHRIDAMNTLVIKKSV